MFNSVLKLSKNNLIFNLGICKNKCKKICAMVKANAYGHGLKFVCETLKNRVDFFGVAILEEALEIRKFDKTSKILLVGLCDDFEKLIDNEISFCVENLNNFQNLLDFLKKNEKKHAKIAKVHIKINSGMNRFGISTVPEFEKILRIYLKSPLKKYILIEGIYTHFATLGVDEKFVNKQIEVFKNFLKIVPSYINPIVHIGGGEAENIVGQFENCMLRVGLNLYTRPRPVMKIQSKLVKIFMVKKGERVGYSNKYIAQSDEIIGIVPLGYADGINRKLSGAFVKIGEDKCQIVGNICMDMFFVRLSKNYKLSERVEVFFNAKMWAKKMQTIPYEVLTGINSQRLQIKFE